MGNYRDAIVLAAVNQGRTLAPPLPALVSNPPGSGVEFFAADLVVPSPLGKRLGVSGCFQSDTVLTIVVNGIDIEFNGGSAFTGETGFGPMDFLVQPGDAINFKIDNAGEVRDFSVYAYNNP